MYIEEGIEVRSCLRIIGVSIGKGIGIGIGIGIRIWTCMHRRKRKPTGIVVEV